MGYITIKRAVVEAAANSTATITADTDIDSPIELKSIDFGEGVEEWCTVAFNGRDITVTATQANTGDNYRTATVNVKCGYWQTSFTVLQKYEGQEYLQYDWTGWTATGSDVQENDGGGYSSLFTEDRTEFWHSYYGEPTPCPHWLLIDMQKELECSRFAIGRREAGGNNYPSVKHMNIYTSTDGENFEQVGEFTFELPWTAPDGTVVEDNSPLVPAEEVITLDKDGFLWLGTDVGLSRYDGIHFHNYNSADKEPYSITGIYETSDKMLWSRIANMNRLSCFNNIDHSTAAECGIRSGSGCRLILWQER